MARVALRLVAVALVIALATAWLGWWSVPVVGFAYGAMDRAHLKRGSIAAVASIIAWAAILGIANARGTDIQAAATRVASVMGVPALALIAVTLIFAAILAGPAAVLGAAISDRLTRAPTTPTPYPPAA